MRGMFNECGGSSGRRIGQFPPFVLYVQIANNASGRGELVLMWLAL